MLVALRCWFKEFSEMVGMRVPSSFVDSTLVSLVGSLDRGGRAARVSSLQMDEEMLSLERILGQEATCV